MTRSDLFLHAVVMFAGRSHANNAHAANCIDVASKLEPEALAEVPAGRAAMEFVYWQLTDDAHPKRMPKWLADYEKVANDRVLVRVNEEVACTVWWMHAERAYEDALSGGGPLFPKECAGLVIGREASVIVTRQQAALFKQWVESIPGHEEQPFAFEEAPPR